MGWKKINSVVELWEKPCLGNVKPKEGERFMALCVDPSSKNPYRGLARQVLDREGNEDIPGFIDISKLVVVESNDLLNWTIVKDLEIRGIDDIIEKFQRDETIFIGLEDPDIVIDENGIKHIYFTIPFRYIGENRYDIYLGHASGKSLNKLLATSPVLGPIGENIFGFKELAYSPIETSDLHLHLVEAMMKEGKNGFSAIATVRADGWAGQWEYEKIALHPWKMKYSWCKGHASPCKILPKTMIDVEKDLFVLIINGRESDKFKDGKRLYCDFKPGLAFYNPETGEISWVAEKPLFKDPDATTITFASDVVPFDKEHFILYAHVNDSFVRAYRIKYREIRKLLPRKI